MYACFGNAISSDFATVCADPQREFTHSRMTAAKNRVSALHTSTPVKFGKLGNVQRSLRVEASRCQLKTKTVITLSRNWKPDVQALHFDVKIRHPGDSEWAVEHIRDDLEATWPFTRSARAGTHSTPRRKLVDVGGLEPPTPCLQSRCSAS
jgi:hypothetical protein